MFKELDSVVLNNNLKEYGLKKGDVGAVVFVYKNGKAIEVEFVTANKTVAVLTLTPKDIRLMAKNEILHARGYANL